MSVIAPSAGLLGDKLLQLNRHTPGIVVTVAGAGVASNVLIPVLMDWLRGDRSLTPCALTATPVEERVGPRLEFGSDVWLVDELWEIIFRIADRIGVYVDVMLTSLNAKAPATTATAPTM